MWPEAMRRRRYLRDRAEEAGGGAGPRRSRDWLYESYYCMSQQHPLIVFLLLLVMGACLALLAVFFALRLVSGLPAGPAPRVPGPPAPPACPRPALLGQGRRAREKFPWTVLPRIKFPGRAPGGPRGVRLPHRGARRIRADGAQCPCASRSVARPLSCPVSLDWTLFHCKEPALGKWLMTRKMERSIFLYFVALKSVCI